ncbi:hypothetical protein HUJ05_000557 [Dendroctonus ponderosae]|nr:hypothetical protein HUJ05_000557 [Dendroctonus ponderosae]
MAKKHHGNAAPLLFEMSSVSVIYFDTIYKYVIFVYQVYWGIFDQFFSVFLHQRHRPQKQVVPTVQVFSHATYFPIMDDIVGDKNAKFKELYNQDGVFLRQAGEMYTPMFGCTGSLYLWEHISDAESKPEVPSRFLEWRPQDFVELKTALDEGSEEWTLIESVKKRCRTSSGNMVKDFLNSIGNLNVCFSNIKSLRCSKHDVLTTFYDGSCELLASFVFPTSESREHFLGTIQAFVRLQPTRRDKSLFIVYDAASPGFKDLEKSFAALDLKTDSSFWSLLKNIKSNPYEKSMEAFAKVTGYVYNSVDDEEHYMAQDDLQRSISEIGDDASAYAVYDIPNCLPMRVDYPRCNPLTREQWRAQLNGEGQLEDGISPDIRRVVWKFLLGYYPWDSTEKERHALDISKMESYYKIKMQWTTFSKEQEDNFSDFSQRKSLIEKDVNRTDRVLDFYAGENNYNIFSLNNILLTYLLYNFDLGYVQGMSDLLSPIYMLLRCEVEAFWCFVGFMKQVMSNFDYDQNAMKEQLKSMYLLVNFIDPQLSKYFEDHECANMYFCFRWLLVWYKRELQQDEVARLWEVLWTGYPCKNFHLLIGVAILEHERDALMGDNNGFTEILKFINELTGKLDINLMINHAEGIYHQIKDADHLTDASKPEDDGSPRKGVSEPDEIEFEKSIYSNFL